jgi:MFS superfamily sulfate permease-like transporter
MINSPIWAVMDIIDAITIAVWIPILMTIAIRELSNSSTQRILISSLIIGIVIAIFVYFMRPTLFGA